MTPVATGTASETKIVVQAVVPAERMRNVVAIEVETKVARGKYGEIEIETIEGNGMIGQGIGTFFVTSSRV